jgi:ABC-type transporter Mla subunit MlaD
MTREEIVHAVKNVRHYIAIGRDLGAHEREYFVTDIHNLCAAALMLSEPASVDIADLHKSSHPQAAANAASWPKAKRRGTSVVSSQHHHTGE